ncbi:vicilin-like seed storage protein At2g28490 [Gastrolobium bilobum]|uniref:vicilin-like seed storage protein At2g28490 n=1 Tax=Gastrolobium bilobum TaxID=150636 RepID=UPI002AB30176|nr:vicilin-like seed storage protein At2g28490 [Gastrolobium bilobum]
MGNKATLLIFLLVLCHGVAVTMGLWRTEVEEREEDPPRPNKLFLMQNSKVVAKTDAGEMRVLESYGGRIMERRLHIGFITMESRSLFIPQYLDSTLIIFVRRGEAKVGFMYKDELEERKLKMGDVYQIPVGSTFYLENIMEGQTLHIICSIDPSESLGLGAFKSFYIGGGANPASVLFGFEPEILESAFNVSGAELRKFFTEQHEGPIVHVGDSHVTSIWTKFLQLKKEDKVQHLKKMVQDQEEQDDDDDDDDDDEEEEQQLQKSWSWRKLLESVFGNENKKDTRDNKGSHHKSPHSYNLYDRKPDFKNSYGWSVALDGSDYSPLKSSGVGIYHVNLTAGSMMTPHVNPRATEYGIVLRGSGRIQIVFPNGSNAMNTQIKEGDVFFVPRYFAFCQIASRSEPLEFFGFTTSARRNKPQFLVGATSLLRTMMGPELAAAFGVTQDTMRHVINAQHESVILPAPRAAHEEQNNKNKVETLPKFIMNGLILGL